MEFGNILATFKKSEDPVSLAPLMNEKDASLKNGLAAWSSVKIKIEMTGEDPESESESDLWEWLWSHVKYNPKHFAIIAGVNEVEIETLFIRLKGLRLIYPDGTICKFASDYMKAIIMAEIRKSQKNIKPTTK